MRVLMVFDRMEQLKYWLNTRALTNGRVSASRQAIVFGDGSELTCAVVKGLDDCYRLAGREFDLVLYDEMAQPTEAAKTWITSRVRSFRMLQP